MRKNFVIARVVRHGNPGDLGACADIPENRTAFWITTGLRP
jgi:hypothetical protein